MNRAREGWSHGVPVAEADDFRRMVMDTVAQVEAICRRNQVKPSQLPGPSYRAYRYLKSLDLAALPVCDESAAPSRAVRIKNAIATANRIRADLLALPGRAEPAALQHGPAAALLKRIQSQSRAIEEICARLSSSPARLPLPSRRAYQWLKFLSATDNLLSHWATLALVREIIGSLRWIKQRWPGYAFSFEIYPSDYLYRAQVNHTQVRIVAAPGFVGAPPDALEALVRAAVSRRQASATNAVKRYINGEDFAEASLAFELCLERPDGGLKGRHYDLAEVFARVNAAYFDGCMPRPRLQWSRTVTERTMGHYQVESDTVMISIALDDHRVPQYAIDFVMYHELLHKQLGVQFVDGRHYAHTRAFREAEKRFKRYDDAEAFLQSLAR